jgi:hypothetical protein
VGECAKRTFQEIRGGANPEDCESNLKSGRCLTCPVISCPIYQERVRSLKEQLGVKYSELAVTPYQEGKIPKKREVWKKEK